MKKDSVENQKEDFISMNNIYLDDVIINFGFGTKEEKKNFLREHASKSIYMDLTCYDPKEFYEEFPQLKGIFSALFADEAKRIEIHFREENPLVLNHLKELGYHPIQVSFTSCGFIFPRTISQIINEAYFALEDGIATKEDINRAMKFGVNYPKGPFEWSEGKELYIKTLLEELHTLTKDNRYIPNKALL